MILLSQHGVTFYFIPTSKLWQTLKTVKFKLFELVKNFELVVSGSSMDPVNKIIEKKVVFNLFYRIQNKFKNGTP